MIRLRIFFERKQRLTKKSEFDALYTQGIKRAAGPLLVHSSKNGLEFSRLGLSVPKRVGNAVVRNRIRRLCREAFRKNQHAFKEGVDVLLTIRPHKPLTLAEYEELLLSGVNHE